MTKLRRFSESLPMLLLRARETAMARFRPILHDHGLTEQQWRVLRALDDIGPFTAAKLSRECVILAPSMTRILRKLANEKLITTTKSKRDQREVNVQMSASGQALVERLAPLIEAEYAVLIDRLDPDDYALLSRELKKLIEIGS